MTTLLILTAAWTIAMVLIPLLIVAIERWCHETPWNGY